MLNEIANKIEAIENFPKKGITFRHIGPLLADHKLFSATIKLMAKLLRDSGLKDIDYIAGMESRGFLFIPLALEMGCGFVMLRKPNKLPNTVSLTYEKEYGTDTLTIEENSLPPGAKVLIVDDLIATGGTIYAGRELIKMIGAEPVGAIAPIRLTGLKLNENLGDFPILSLMDFEA